VQLPTGGNGFQALTRERQPKPVPLGMEIGWVSRFGAIPKPTVKVRMKENGTAATHAADRLLP